MNVPIGCPPTHCVAEIRMDDHGNPFGELTPFVHFFGDVPKSGTKLYTQAEPKELSDEDRKPLGDFARIPVSTHVLRLAREQLRQVEEDDDGNNPVYSAAYAAGFLDDLIAECERVRRNA